MLNAQYDKKWPLLYWRISVCKTTCIRTGSLRLWLKLQESNNGFMILWNVNWSYQNLRAFRLYTSYLVWIQYNKIKCYCLMQATCSYVDHLGTKQVLLYSAYISRFFSTPLACPCPWPIIPGYGSGWWGNWRVCLWDSFNDEPVSTICIW